MPYDIPSYGGPSTYLPPDPATQTTLAAARSSFYAAIPYNGTGDEQNLAGVIDGLIANLASKGPQFQGVVAQLQAAVTSLKNAIASGQADTPWAAASFKSLIAGALSAASAEVQRSSNPSFDYGTQAQVSGLQGTAAANNAYDFNPGREMSVAGQLPAVIQRLTEMGPEYAGIAAGLQGTLGRLNAAIAQSQNPATAYAPGSVNDPATSASLMYEVTNALGAAQQVSRTNSTENAYANLAGNVYNTIPPYAGPPNPFSLPPYLSYFFPNPFLNFGSFGSPPFFG